MSARTVLTPAVTGSAARPLSILTAAAAAIAVWIVTVPVAGIEVAARSGGGIRTIGPVAVVVAALLAGLAGWGLLALLERTTARARRVWTVIATVVLAASLIGPLAGVDGASVLALVAMHLAPGAVLIALLPRPAAHR